MSFKKRREKRAKKLKKYLLEKVAYSNEMNGHIISLIDYRISEINDKLEILHDNIKRIRLNQMKIEDQLMIDRTPTIIEHEIDEESDGISIAFKIQEPELSVSEATENDVFN
jgi:hypothetical protein